MNYPFKKGREEQARTLWSNVRIESFPDRVHVDDVLIASEREFQLMVCCSTHIQRSLGWHGIKNSQVFYPDITADLGDGDTLRVELEYKAENFRRHGHKMGGCDLIVTFIRNYHDNMIAGVPVWSFYRRDSKGWLDWSLWSDIRENGYEQEYSIQL